MNRYLVVLGIVAIIIGVIVIAPFLFASGLGGNLGVQYLDENGEPIGAPAAFIGNGETVTGFTVTVKYTITASGEPQDLFVDGKITIKAYVNTPTAGDAGSASTIISSGKTSQTFTQSYFFDSFIKTDSTGKTNGWRIVVSAQLTATATIDNEQRTSTWSDELSFIINWQDSEFVLGGSLGV